MRALLHDLPDLRQLVEDAVEGNARELLSVALGRPRGIRAAPLARGNDLPLLRTPPELRFFEVAQLACVIRVVVLASSAKMLCRHNSLPDLPPRTEYYIWWIYVKKIIPIG